VTGRDRIGWLLLLAAAMALGVLEMRPPPPRPVPLDRMSIRITVAADGAMRVEAPDGTDVTFPSPPLDEPRKADEILMRLRAELSRLDPSADPDRLFEIASYPSVPFRRLIWVLRCTCGVNITPSRRQFAFSLIGDRGSSVVSSHEIDGYPSPLRTLVPIAKIRLLGQKAAGRESSAALALAAAEVEFDHGPPPEVAEDGPWSAIEPRREVVRDWLARATDRSGDRRGALILRERDNGVPFGVAFEVMRGYADAGIPFDVRLDSTR
jgi:hypothetical protein